MQERIEALATQYITQKQTIGLHNTALMVLDTRSMQVVTEVGSVDYYNADIQGQVNGVQALRSPGSTLKPFIYALAMEQGLIHPQSIVKDAPKRFGAYTPEKLFTADHYGLALALGGNEVTMLELVELYASLANLGKYQQASYMKSNTTAAKSKTNAKKILSPEAAFLTLKMLNQNTSTDSNDAIKQLQKANGRSFKHSSEWRAIFKSKNQRCGLLG